MHDIDIVVEELGKAINAVSKAHLWLNGISNRDAAQEAMLSDLEAAMAALAGRRIAA